MSLIEDYDLAGLDRMVFVRHSGCSMVVGEDMLESVFA